jgi:alpha-tubulin suppressor-like RCC1 family protein
MWGLCGAAILFLTGCGYQDDRADTVRVHLSVAQGIQKSLAPNTSPITDAALNITSPYFEPITQRVQVNDKDHNQEGNHFVRFAVDIPRINDITIQIALFDSSGIAIYRFKKVVDLSDRAPGEEISVVLTEIKPVEHTLTILMEGTGTGTVVQAQEIGTSQTTPKVCQTKDRLCSALLPAGTSIALKAISSKESVFVGWTGDCAGTTPLLSVMIRNKEFSCTATFNTTISTAPLLAPTGVSALVGNNQVTLSWSAVSEAAFYNVYMATVSGVTKTNYANLTGGMFHTQIAKNYYIHTSLTNGTQYFFIVTAVNAGGESPLSVEQSAIPQNTSTILSITSGNNHTCALIVGGTGKCWGNNWSGKLGDETLTNRSTPVAISGISAATTIAAGGNHTCARVESGRVQCWGYNGSGQLGNGTVEPALTPVAVSGITTATAIGTGGGYTCALLSGGTVQCWGKNSYGQIGNGTVDNALTPVAVSKITAATALSVGNNHACARIEGGTVKCWGEGGYGQLGNGITTHSSTPVTVTGINTAIAIAAGNDHACALLASGTVQCWGNNGWGQLGNGATTHASTPVAVIGTTAAKAIATGGYHTCALLAGGTAQCWGNNKGGQLGNGTTPDSSKPVEVTGMGTATALSGGYAHTCAILSGGTVQCWGLNLSGQLGNGTTTDSSVPATVIGLP